MSKRLQVVLGDAEYARFQRAAKREGLTTSEWVRQVLRRAERMVPSGNPDRKLAAIRAAAAHSFPSGDIEEMLADIEHGYLEDGG